MSWDDEFPDEQTNPSGRMPTQGQGPRPGQQPPHFPNEPSQQFAVPQQGHFPNDPSQQFGIPHAQQPHQGGGYPQQNPSGPYPNPQTGGFPAAGPMTGPQPIIRNNTSGMNAVGNPGFPNEPSGFQHAQAPQSAPRAPSDEPSRVVYGVSGFVAGVVIGIFLGLVNSALEDQPFSQGFELTIQMATWFGLFIGILAAWRPERFEYAKDRFFGLFGAND